MLTFFRKVRKNLLEENRVGKYLTYASGEIVLVVMGILIALQVNNWREQVNNRETECTYLTSLKQDLERQIETVDAQSDFESDVIKSAESLIEMYYASNRFEVNKDFSSEINTLNNRFTFRTSSSTYEELLSTGSMSIISSDALKNDLMNFYQTLNRQEQVITRNNQFLDNHFVPLMFDLVPHETPQHQIDLYNDNIGEELVNTDLIDRDIKDDVYYSAVEEHLSDPVTEMGLLNRIEYRHRVSAVHLSLMFNLRELTGGLLRSLSANRERLCQ